MTYGKPGSLYTDSTDISLRFLRPAMRGSVELAQNLLLSMIGDKPSIFATMLYNSKLDHNDKLIIQLY